MKTILAILALSFCVTAQAQTTNVTVTIPVWAYRAITNQIARAGLTNEQGQAISPGRFLSELVAQDLINLRERIRVEQSTPVARKFEDADDATKAQVKTLLGVTEK